MKPSSAKAKGRALQQYVRDAIYKQFPQLEAGDVRSTSMGASGADVLLSPRAKECFNFAIECKNLSAFVGYTYYDQATTHRERGDEVPIAVVKKNGRKPLVVLDFDDFMRLQYQASTRD